MRRGSLSAHHDIEETTTPSSLSSLTCCNKILVNEEKHTENQLQFHMSRGRSHLPFGYCALTSRPFTQAVVHPDNPTVLYDSAAILPFVLQYQRDPCTGQPCTSQDLVTLQMERYGGDDPHDNDGTAAGEPITWQCPVLSKVLTDHSKIVAIRQASHRQIAHVYSYQAYQTLNLQAKNYTDLTTGEPFDPRASSNDVLVLRDPDHLDEIPRLENFYYITHAKEFPSLLAHDQTSKSSNNIRQSATASRILAQLEKSKTNKKSSSSSTATLQRPSAKRPLHNNNDNGDNNNDNDDDIILAQDVTGVAFTTAAGAASLTSTGMDLVTTNTARPATEEEIIQAQCRMLLSLSASSSSKGKKKKGMVRLVLADGRGSLTLEIHTDIVPRTAMNFMGLCATGRYNGTSFHRLIPGFMIQGGGQKGKRKASTDTTTTSQDASTALPEEEDSSLWGGAFPDEFDDRLKHDGRGIVAMANAGPHTNKQQFYITFAASPHLNRKHSVFGRVVSGMDVLDQLERLGRRSKDDKPLTKIVIDRVDILENPVPEALEKETRRIQKLQQARRRRSNNNNSQLTPNSSTAPAPKKAKGSTSEGATTTQGSAGGGGDATIGRYLQQRLASSKTSGDKTSSNNTKKKSQAQTKTTFGNFSGW